jgi:hypothetical protein
VSDSAVLRSDDDRYSAWWILAWVIRRYHEAAHTAACQLNRLYRTGICAGRPAGLSGARPRRGNTFKVELASGPSSGPCRRWRACRNEDRGRDRRAGKGGCRPGRRPATVTGAARYPEGSGLANLVYAVLVQSMADAGRVCRMATAGRSGRADGDHPPERAATAKAALPPRSSATPAMTAACSRRQRLRHAADSAVRCASRSVSTLRPALMRSRSTGQPEACSSQDRFPS